MSIAYQITLIRTLSNTLLISTLVSRNNFYQLNFINTFFNFYLRKQIINILFVYSIKYYSHLH